MGAAVVGVVFTAGEGAAAATAAVELDDVLIGVGAAFELVGVAVELDDVLAGIGAAFELVGAAVGLVGVAVELVSPSPETVVIAGI